MFRSLIAIALKAGNQNQIACVYVPQPLDAKLKFFIFMPMVNMPAVGVGQIFLETTALSPPILECQDLSYETKRQGQLAGAEAVLRLRSILKSNDLDAYWEYHIKEEYCRVHGSKFSKAQNLLGFSS